MISASLLDSLQAAGVPARCMWVKSAYLLNLDMCLPFYNTYDAVRHNSGNASPI